MNIRLKVWRQKSRGTPGKFVIYDAPDIPSECSFLEMLDIVNERLTEKGDDPIAFDHDCREGICGTCALNINGLAHGPSRGTTTCQQYMRNFAEGETILIEPFRARAFPVIKDLICDRSAFDRIIQAGGFISVHTGAAPDGNAIPISKPRADAAMEAAACIGCGACVAACPNASAMLYVGAKVSHLNLLPQGAPEQQRRVLGMVRQMDAEGFGNCSNHYECEAVCPAEIPATVITRLNRQFAISTATETVA